MPTVAGFAADLRTASRRLVRSVPAVLDASFHPFRTVRDGTRLVQGLLAPEQSVPVPPPTEAAAPADRAPIHRPVPESVAESALAPAQAPEPAEPTDSPEPTELAAEPAAEPVVEPALDDRPILSRGPAPHVPPAIAAEVERDYGDEIPGITPGE
jgi:hypothetical protein